MFENIPLFTRVLTVALLCCSCSGATVCAASPIDEGAQPTVVRLGVPPLGDTLLPVIGAKKGWYKDEGLSVEIKALDWNEIHASLTVGKIDVGISNIATTVATHAKAPEIVYAYALNTFDNGLALMVRPNGGLKPLDAFLGQFSTREEAIAAAAGQLKGRTIVTTSNTHMEQALAFAARRGGLAFKRDLKILDLSPDDGLAAFLAGQGDAYIGGLSQRVRAAKEGMIVMLGGTDLGPSPITGFVTTQRFARDNRETVLKLIKVWFRIVNYVNSNIDEGGAIIADELKSRSETPLTLDEFKRFWNKIEHFPASAADVEADILSPLGRNYWKPRWISCNYYYVKIVGSISQQVSPENIFIMHEIHREYVERFGNDRDRGASRNNAP
jgi:ABC-type nitrate/sulfonate/bicarbonate transport system substrate-binding protein